MGVGISFGIVLIALLSLIAFRLSRKSRNKHQDLGNGGEYIKNFGDRKDEVNPSVRPLHELTSEENPREMDTLHNTHKIEFR